MQFLDGRIYSTKGYHVKHERQFERNQEKHDLHWTEEYILQKGYNVKHERQFERNQEKHDLQTYPR